MIVIATPEELKLTEQRSDILITGVGATNVIKSLKDVPRDTSILNLGYAGSKYYKIGEKVEIGKVMLYHPTVEYPEEIFELDGDTLCYTGNDFVTHTDLEEPCVFDMELAYILAMGFKNVKSIKTISDNLNLDEYGEILCLKK